MRQYLEIVKEIYVYNTLSVSNFLRKLRKRVIDDTFGVTNFLRKLRKRDRQYPWCGEFLVLELCASCTS
jgi:hypothetical protein